MRRIALLAMLLAVAGFTAVPVRGEIRTIDITIFGMD